MVTFLGERTGIAREPQAVQRPNSTLPLGLDVANVTTADPGVQVENVSARGRRTRYQRVPGSPLWSPGGRPPYPRCPAAPGLVPTNPSSSGPAPPAKRTF